MRLIAGADNMLGDFGVQAADTLGAKIKNLKNLPDQFFEKFAESPAYDRLKVRLDELFVALDPSSERGARIFSAMDKAFDRIVTGVENIDIDQVATSIEEIVGGLSAAFKAIGPMIEVAAKGAEKIAELLAPFLDTKEPAALKAMNTNAGFRRSGSPEEEVPDWLIPKGASADQRKAITAQAKFGADPVSQTVGRGNEVAGAFAVGMKSGFSVVADASSGLGKTAMAALDTTLERHSPPKVFLRVGQDIPKAIAMGIDDERASVEDSMRGVVSPEDSVPMSRGGATTSTAAPSITIQVNVGGDVNQGNVEELGQQIGDAIEERLLRFYENQRAEQGR